MFISKIKNKIASLDLNIFDNVSLISENILFKSLLPKNFVSLLLISFFLFSSFSFLNLKTSYAQAQPTKTCPAGQYFDTGFNSCQDNSNKPEGYNSNTAPTSESVAPLIRPASNTPCVSTVTYDAMGMPTGGGISGECTGDTNTGTFNSTTGVLTPSSKVNQVTTFCEDLSWTNGIVGGVKQAGCYIVYGLMKVILEVIGGFARLSAGLFDLAVDGYVLNIKTLFLQDGVSGQDKAWLYKSWAVIRDVTNILMFFSAMYVGVRYMLGSEELDFKKSLIKIIIFAVFVNFSFAFSKFAIDISNFLSLSIRGGITGYSPSAKLSDILMSYTGISSLVTEVASFAPRNFTGYTNWTTMALAIVFLAATFFVFLYSAIMILLRAIVLLVCVIFSPLMFLTSSFKSMEKINQIWRDNFIGQLLFGPVLMLGLWVSFGFLKATKEIGGGADISSIQNAAGAVSGSASMILAILALLLAVFAANKVSTGLGGAIGGFVGSGMKNIGLGVATGGAGFAIRGVAGRAGAAIASSKWLKDKAQNGNFISRRVASGMSLAGDKMANAKVTIGGRTTTSTADKNNQAKDKMNKDQSDFIENNKGAINANPALRDELYKARGDKNKFAIVSAKLDPKNAGKTDGQLSRELGIVSDSDIEKAKARKLENKDNLQANRVSSSNADAYLDAKEVDDKENAGMRAEMEKASSERLKKEEENKSLKENKELEIKSLEQSISKLTEANKNTTYKIGIEANNNDIATQKARILKLKEEGVRLDQMMGASKSEGSQELKLQNTADQYKNTNRIANAAFATGKGVSNAAVFLRGGKKSNSTSPAANTSDSNPALTSEQSANLKK